MFSILLNQDVWTVINSHSYSGLKAESCQYDWDINTLVKSRNVKLIDAVLTKHNPKLKYKRKILSKAIIIGSPEACMYFYEHYRQTHKESTDEYNSIHRRLTYAIFRNKVLVPNTKKLLHHVVFETPDRIKHIVRGLQSKPLVKGTDDRFPLIKWAYDKFQIKAEAFWKACLASSVLTNNLELLEWIDETTHRLGMSNLYEVMLNPLLKNFNKKFLDALCEKKQLISFNFAIAVNISHYVENGNYDVVKWVLKNVSRENYSCDYWSYFVCLGRKHFNVLNLLKGENLINHQNVYTIFRYRVIEHSSDTFTIYRNICFDDTVSTWLETNFQNGQQICADLRGNEMIELCVSHTMERETFYTFYKIVETCKIRGIKVDFNALIPMCSHWNVSSTLKHILQICRYIYHILKYRTTMNLPSKFRHTSYSESYCSIRNKNDYDKFWSPEISHDLIRLGLWFWRVHRHLCIDLFDLYNMFIDEPLVTNNKSRWNQINENRLDCVPKLYYTLFDEVDKNTCIGVEPTHDDQ